MVRVSGYRYRGPGFDPRRYQIFWVVVGLERGPLSLVRSIEELLEWKSSGSRSRKQRLTAVGTRCADHVTPLYPQKLALTSPTGGGRPVGIVRVRTKATELVIGLMAACLWLYRLCCVPLVWPLPVLCRYRRTGNGQTKRTQHDLYNHMHVAIKPTTSTNIEIFNNFIYRNIYSLMMIRKDWNM